MIPCCDATLRGSQFPKRCGRWKCPTVWRAFAGVVVLAALGNSAFGLTFTDNSLDFAYRYEANDLPNVETTEGWDLVTNPATLTGDSFTTSAGILSWSSPLAGGRWWRQTDSTDAWNTQILSNTSYSIECRVRVTESDGALPGLHVAADNGVYGGWFSVGTNDIRLGTSTSYNVLASGLDNASDYHVFRFDYNATATSFDVYRDDQLLASNQQATAAASNRLYFGDASSSGSGTVNLDYFRWDPVTSPPADTTIVTFGDSTTAPRTVDGQPLYIYSNILRDELPGKGVNADVINAGIGGNTTADAIARLDSDVRSYDPDVVVVQFGINDSKVEVSQGATTPRVDLADYVANLTTIVETLKADGVRVILMTPNALSWTDTLLERYGQPPYDPNDPMGFNATLTDYVEAVRTIAATEDVELVDIYQTYLDYQNVPDQDINDLLLDGIHPNAIGHRIVADRLLATIPEPSAAALLISVLLLLPWVIKSYHRR